AQPYRSMWQMVAASGQMVDFLQGRLRPRVPLDPGQRQRVAQLIAALDSDRFTARDKATRNLEALGWAAEGDLRQALMGNPPPELRVRAHQLLEKLQAPRPSPELLRELRAVEVLEQLGTPAARQLLASLSQGAAEHRVTQEAAASLGRLRTRQAQR